MPSAAIMTVTEAEKRLAQVDLTNDDQVSTVVNEILSLYKAGKAITADQKTAVYTMLTNVPGNDAWSSAVVGAITGNLGKETQEACVRGAMSAVERHLAHCMRHDDATTCTAAAKVLNKEMTNVKIPIRKLVCAAVGEVVWAQSSGKGASTAAATTFVESILPALEANLKNASAKTLTSPSGPLEGYVAVAVLLGRAAGWEGSSKIDSVLAKNEILQTVHATAPKASFLLNDKVIRKVSVAEEEMWLLRALDGLLVTHAKQVSTNPSAIEVVALAIRQIAFSSKTVKGRGEAVTTLHAIANRDLVLATEILRQGLLTWLTTQPIPTIHTDGQDAGEKPKDKDFSRAIKKLMAAVCSAVASEAAKLDTLTQLFVLSHHPELGMGRRQTFVGLCQLSKVDASTLADVRMTQLLADAKQSLSVPHLRQAALDALSTLVLLSAEETSGLLMDDIRAGLGMDGVNVFTPQDLGIWQTAPETLFVDILAQIKSKSVDAAGRKGGKESAMEKWDAELRESIAKKKTEAGKTLTKQEQAAVDAQLATEKEVRARVAETQARLSNALAMVVSLVEARTPATDDKMGELMHMLLALLSSPAARKLVLYDAQRALESLATCCSERMAEYATFVRIALLRTIDDSLAGADFAEESFKDLVLRVLYRLHSLSEQAPLDLASISFVEPLLSRTIHGNGLGVSADDADGTLEQVQLALEIIAFHGEACRDGRFPRLAFIDDLAHVVSSSTQLAKDAVGALRTLGDAMKSNATPIESQRILLYTLAEEVYVRTGALQALQPLDLTDIDFCAELWLACHDEDEENARLANKAWEENGLDIEADDYAAVLLPMLEHAHAFVRQATAKAIGTACELHPETASSTTTALIALYEERNKILETEYDRFGMPIEATVNREDPWKSRAAIGATFACMAHPFSVDDLVVFFGFLIDKQALGDRHDQVRRAMLQAGTAIVDGHGDARLSELISMFEDFLQRPSASTNDDITEAVIILFGRLAKHLPPKDPRVSQVVRRLVEALKTPSELVQVAVSDCLASLSRHVDEDVPALFESLFKALLQAQKYGERRGAAYGLAGLIKGRGISSIAEFDVMTRLEDAVDADRKNFFPRQGAMMAYETMIAGLQRLFEPYVPQILPQMLTCFGDGTADVRDATQETARVLMQNISGYGVRLIMPSLLAGLEDKQWRIKKGAIELLGAMAYCAPRQLSFFLPTVIPQLNEPIKDSHKQVRLAAEAALKGFGDVISNPEVKKLVPIIMKALVDPARTATAQQAILTQKWIHVLDGPSLALLVPVIDRGLRERGAQVQKDAARIVGNLASLTDSKDFVPYLRSLVPLVRAVLVSPVPDARATAAKSLGTLVERLGEVHFVDLVPSLLQVLKSEASSVDRQGAAQGLAEVLAGLGVERMEALLPDVINSAQHATRPSVRESHVLLLIFLPATFGLRFSPYLGRIIPPILGGIADESEHVREASMRAGRMIIANYSARAVDLLLPELEQGLFHASWRIRLSSVQLIADLIFRLAGITGTNEVENETTGEGDEDGGAETNVVAANSIQRTLAEALGAERRDTLLAKLYVLRQDVVVNVRQATIQLWKSVVSNTPKVVREILPLLVDLLVDLLSRDDESREMSARTLAELVSKLGERILTECIPMLRLRGVSDDAALRTGVCFAVTEVLNNGSDDQLHDHQDSLIAIVRNGLTDASSDVREAAAEAFDSLHERLGSYAVDEIVPGLLETLTEGNDDEEDDDDEDDEDEEEDDEDDEDRAKAKESAAGKKEEASEDSDGEDDESEEEYVDNSEQGRALSALQEIMKSNAYSVFPALVPTLIQQPMTPFNATALASLASQAGNAVNSSLSTMMEAWVESIETAKANGAEDEDESERHELLHEALSTMMSGMYESEGVYELMDVLLSWTASTESVEQRIRGCRYFALFCQVKDADADMGIYGIYWVQRLVKLFNDNEAEVVDAAVAGMDALIQIVAKEDLENIVVPMREVLRTTGQAGTLLPGFLRPRGAAPLGAVFLAGLMNGTGEQREKGAMGLADTVERSSADSIKPLIVSMIGPLIRSCGDRHLSNVKYAILYALTAMLRFPQHCKPFFPQLQRSFQKSILDATDEDVRNQAQKGLDTLMEHHARGFKPQ